MHYNKTITYSSAVMNVHLKSSHFKHVMQLLCITTFSCFNDLIDSLLENYDMNNY